MAGSGCGFDEYGSETLLAGEGAESLTRHRHRLRFFFLNRRCYKQFIRNDLTICVRPVFTFFTENIKQPVMRIPKQMSDHNLN